TVVFWHWWRRILQFGFYTRRFKTLSGTEILLRYAPELKSQMDLKKHIVLWERALAELRKQFGFSLRHRLVVFLFPTVAEMQHLFEVDMGAGAWPHGDAVLVAADYFQTSDFPEECMRHELAHLFSARWGYLEPPVKGEGLAVWLQGAEQGKPLDFYALTALLGSRSWSITYLSAESVFYDRAHRPAHYALVGSFTGSLMKCYGWAAYERWFRRASAYNFKAVFKEVFGASFLTVEKQWHQALLARRSEFDPGLTAAIMEQRVESDLAAGHFYRCL